MNVHLLKVILLLLSGVLRTVRCCNNTFTIYDDLYSVEKRLVDSLKENYDPTIRPWIGLSKCLTSPFLVHVEFGLHALLEIDEKGETMTTSMAIAMYWWDSKMIWDPAVYGNITHVYMQAKNVWRPLWFITNSVDRDSVMRFEDWIPIVFDYDGEAMWQQMGTIKTTCSIDTTYFPFDKQVCSINFHWYEYQIIARDLDVNVSERTRFYKDNGLWEFVGYDILTNDDDLPAYKIVYTFKRKPDYMIYNVLFPVLLIALLGPLVFLIPVECGERVSYSITVLLTVSVYMTIISDYLPNSSRPMAYMIYGLFSLEVFCALIVVVVIFTTKVYHCNSSAPMPRSLITFMNLFKCFAACKKFYSVMRESGRGLFRMGKDQMEQRNDMELNDDLDKETHLMEEQYIYDVDIKETGDNTGNENSQYAVTWLDIVITLDRIALYTFYITV